MNKINLIYEIEGDIDDGIDVFELAPTMLSIGKLIQESNKTIYPHGKEIAVNIKPFKKGSFIIDILLFAKTNFQPLIDLANQNSVQEIKELLEWIGIISGGAYGGAYTLINLVKYFKGKPNRVEKLENGDYKYTDENNASITVNNKVHGLFQNTNIQKVIYNVYGAPLQRTDVTGIKSFIKDQEKETKTEVKKGEAQYFKNYSELEIPSVEEDDVISNTITLILNPKRGSFEGEANAWSFRAGESIITATVKDEEFLSKIRAGEIRLYSGDTIKAKLIMHQRKSGTITYEVIRVEEYISSKHSEQTSFDHNF